MKKFFKYFGLVLALISVSVLVSGCSSRSNNEDNSNNIVIWGFDDEDVWKPFMREVQGETNIESITYVKKSLNDNYENDALNSILSGQGPDVWAIPNDWVYRHKDKLAPMPEEFVEDINIESQFVEVVKDSVVFDGKVYGLAPTVDTLVLYYNNKMFDEVLEEYSSGNYSSEKVNSVNRLLTQAPNTWHDFAEIVKLINRRNNESLTRSAVALGTSNNILYSNDILSALMIQNQTQMSTEDLLTATFNLPSTTVNGTDDIPAKRALNFYTSFSDPDSEYYSWNSGFENSAKAFAEGKTSMIFGYQKLGDYFAQNYPSFTYKTSTFPQIGSSGSNIIDYASFTTFVVPKNSKNIFGSWTIIKNVCTTNIDSYASTVKIASAKKNQYFEPSLPEREDSTNPGKLQTHSAKFWNKGRYPEDVDEIINRMIDNRAIKKQNSQDALDKAAGEVTNMLRKNDW